MKAREDCPFCGSPRTEEIETLSETAYVKCSDCGARGPRGDGTVGDAWREWNKRVIEGVVKP